MKKYILLLFIVLGFVACGGNSGQSQEQTATEEETEIVNDINTGIEDAQKELASEVEEGLTEIDSLLQNVE